MAQKIIGDRTPDGLLEIVDTNWGITGTMQVTIRETIGHNCWTGGFPIDRARTLARSAVPTPELVRSSRIARRFVADGCEYVTFAVSCFDRY